MRKLVLAITAAALATGPALAEGSLKIGLVAPFSGPFADYGKQIDLGIRAYMKEHGDTVAGRKVEVIRKDTTGPVPEIAKRDAQELVVRDHVDVLAGFGLTPEALAVADVATQAKTPMVVMNAASAIIPSKSPYIVRLSMSLPQVSAPLGSWAVKNGLSRVATLVSDYAPGVDSETAFKKAFTEAGGTLVESIRVPLRNPEFAPFIQRIKDAKPQAVFVFLPAGEQGIAFMKGFQERGLAQEGIKVIATGDITDDHIIDSMGDAALGMITTFHYSADHDSPENKAFLKAYDQVKDDAGRPNFMTVAGYDGAAAIYKVAEALGGKFEGDAAMAKFKGLKLDSPRGPVTIDAETRDIDQTMYVRRVEKKDGHYYNVEFDKLTDIQTSSK